jgi:ketosteroid isomerase-like protein
MMSNDLAAKSLVQGMYEAFAAGEVEAVVGAMSEDIVWEGAENFPYAGETPYVGPEAVVNGVFAKLVSEWDDWRLDVEEMLGTETKVVALGRYNAQNKATGTPISAQFAHVWTIEGGKVVRFQQYADTAQVRDAMPSGAREGSTS